MRGANRRTTESGADWQRIARYAIVLVVVVPTIDITVRQSGLTTTKRTPLKLILHVGSSVLEGVGTAACAGSVVE